MTGARQALGGPAEDLLLAYRGTAYFLRALFALREAEYDADRRRTIATVGYDARGWALLAERVREGASEPATFEPGEREAAIELGATLPARALRNLVEHSATHLRVEWRDLPVEGWRGSGRDAWGEPLPVATTPWLRARQTWAGAVELGTGASATDFPPALRSQLSPSPDNNSKETL